MRRTHVLKFLVAVFAIIVGNQIYAIRRASRIIQQNATHANIPSPYTIRAEISAEKQFRALYPHDTIVTEHDIRIGHRWKTFLVPLSQQFHEMPYYFFIQDAKEDRITSDYYANEKQNMNHKYNIDHFAEVVILRKFLASLDFVQDVDDADLILVPALPSLHVSLRCWNFGLCANKWYEELKERIELFQPSHTKKFLYLATQDSSQNHKSIISLMEDPNNFILTLGASGLVVPSLNTMKEMQPKHYKGCLPLENRSAFAISNQRIRPGLHDRISIFAELSAYKGSKTIIRSSHQDLLQMQNAIFTICAPGDLPFQKRFFDALLMCTIPVVVKRDMKGGKKAYYSNVNSLMYDENMKFSVEESYPHLDFPYSDIVVEVDGAIIEKGGLIEYLESITKEEIEQKLKKIGEVRNRFVYDLDGTTEDAFSRILEELNEQIVS